MLLPVFLSCSSRVTELDGRTQSDEKTKCDYEGTHSRLCSRRRRRRPHEEPPCLRRRHVQKVLASTVGLATSHADAGPPNKPKLGLVHCVHPIETAGRS